jgi:hypothetical protein
MQFICRAGKKILQVYMPCNCISVLLSFDGVQFIGRSRGRQKQSADDIANWHQQKNRERKGKADELT